MVEGEPLPLQLVEDHPVVETVDRQLPPFAAERNMSFEQLMEGIEKAVRSYWGKRGEQVVQDNLTCIRRGYQDVMEVPRVLIEDASLDEVLASSALPVVS